MRLSKIKLAGFKSFVDPTTLHLPSNLVGVVGPNGCGKSNVIDAVRWVMGESSAKSLRGESMADVIFNGSNTRKPVGQASIELIFDNTYGGVQGQYASYAEISIRRQLARDGQSSYFLNGTRCRRRDITDIFLGTGLGPHSYAIIEQNMISRLIEAKPDDLRIFLEEAAGVSKYKERRREAEIRMRHTRENLDSLNILREEIGKQLERLQRQARLAEKYKSLKQQERQCEAELLALRTRALSTQRDEQEKTIAEQQTQVEAAIAGQRAIEREIEKTRSEQGQAGDAFNAVQGQFYSVGAEIARLEQGISHAKDRRRQQQQDLTQAERAFDEAEGHLQADREQIAELERDLEETEPERQQAEQAKGLSSLALSEAEQVMQTWQSEWEAFNQSSAQFAQAAEVKRTRNEHLEQQLRYLQQRLSRLEEEQKTLSPVAPEKDISSLSEQQLDHERKVQRLQQDLQDLSARITERRAHNNGLSTALDEERARLEEGRGRLASLQALQQAALGKSQANVVEWLERASLQEAPRLAQDLQVAQGWERALECVLGFHLQAVCVPGLEISASLLGTLEQGALTLFDTAAQAPPWIGSDIAPLLQNKVRSGWRLDGLLAGIYVAETLAEALALCPRLAANESLITRDGIWLGNGWLRVSLDADEKVGVLAREQELKKFAQTLQGLNDRVTKSQRQLEEGMVALRSTEEEREAAQAALNQVQRAESESRAQLTAKQARLDQIRTRSSTIQGETEELQGQKANLETDLLTSHDLLRQALSNVESLSSRRGDLTRLREQHRALLERSSLKARADQDAVHRIALRIQAMQTERHSIQQRLSRMQTQLGQLNTRREELAEGIAEGEGPLAEMQTELEQRLAKRVEVESALSSARRRVEALDQRFRELDQERHQAEQRVQQSRTGLEQSRLHSQELKVRCQTLEEQMKKLGFEGGALLEGLPEGAMEDNWQERLDQLARQIERLGPINLAAIDECAELIERKSYLDAQFADLSEALTTLDDAIRKIDRETRARFKDTFDKVSAGLQGMFPRLFGGGHAYLELTGEDLLDTGVTVMARPPGKRNSNIHLLSGGEKALTAVALVFAIFELNPAPFCLLDEVDAPLDDANVGRFCDLLKEMSQRIQFIYITHNKLTMEIAHQLVGITMHESGVSRLVAVDVSEAAALIAV